MCCVVVAECSRLLDVVLVVDVSASIELDDTFSIVNAFLRQFIHGLGFNFGNTRVGYVTFSQEATSHFYLDSYLSEFAKVDVLNAVVIDHVGINTDLSSGLTEALQNQFIVASGDRLGIDNVLVLVSDGRATIGSPESAETAADQLRARGVDVYAVGVGPSPNSAQMRALSGVENYVEARTVASVDAASSQLLGAIC